MTTKEKAEESKQKKPKDSKVPVFWLDTEEWDECLIPKSEVPKNAKTIDFKGEQVYFLERVRSNGNSVYKPYKPPKPIDKERTAAWVNKATRHVMQVFARRYRPRVERNETFEKGILYAFIFSAIAFMALVVIIVMG